MLRDTIGKDCSDDVDCDDGDFCDGVEVCVAELDDETRKKCQRGRPPCAQVACSRELQRCDCDYRGGDADGDNHRASGCDGGPDADCDDDNADIHPGAAELCDAVDDDCNPKTFGKRDEDRDGVISHECRNLDPENHRWSAGEDLDDSRDDVKPGATELCDGVDNDCDHAVDETGDGKPGGQRTTFYRDRDGDGFGDKFASEDDRLQARCSTPPSKLWSLQATDCNDDDPLVHPGRAELCNDLDEDCDGSIDEPPFDEKPDFTGTELECGGKSGWIITKCPPVTDNCNRVVADGCETRLDTLCNCRVCGSACRFACGATECEEITAFSIGASHTCALTGTRGEIVACWGANHRGQVGDDSINEATRPKRVERLNGVLQVAAGGDHSCAIVAEGGKLFCWGADADGQLGSPATDDHSMIPVPVGGIEGPQLVGVVGVAAGAQHTCAVLNDGRLVCWGRGDGGRLGDLLGTEHVAPAPVQTFRGTSTEPIHNVKQVVAGYQHTCLLTTSGRVECAGDNSLQQLGDGSSTPNANTFQPVAGLEDVEVLSAGSTHTCALSRGRVSCWGANDYGQLGVAESTAGVPAPVEGLGAVRAIATGAAWSCAVDNQDVLRCWGSNVFGQLGDPSLPADDFDPHPLPQVAKVGTVRAVFGGYGAHVCALTSQGRGICWGSNDSGELGNGEAVQGGMPSPRDVDSLMGSVSCGQ